MSDAIAVSFQPRGEALIASGPGWRQEISVAAVGRCQLYNDMEARVEWHGVIPAWDQVAESATGWCLPCRVDIPFVGTVITFDLVATHRPELQAVELSIPATSLCEKDVSFARLMRIDLLPGFAAAAQGEDGYLLLPCLAGALHRFTHQVSREERVVIYARQDQWAMRSNFNCIGMQRPSTAWCAIVTAGEFDAEAVIRSHYEEEASYSVHAGLVYRWEPENALLPGDRTVRFQRSAAGSGRGAALRCLAWGALPFIEVSARTAKEAHSMPTYNQVAEFARAGWELCCAEYGDLVEQDLENVEVLAPDVTRTTFGNGTVLLVNATDAPAAVDGVTVPALGVVRRG